MIFMNCHRQLFHFFGSKSYLKTNVRRSIVTLLLGVVGAVTVSCSGPQGGNGSGGGDNPKSKEEALQKLRPKHRANFEEWQARVLKSCDPSEAFGLHRHSNLEKRGIDGGALIKSNRGSLVLSDDRNLVLLTGYNTFSGVGNSKAEESESVNGQGYSISAETKRSGSHCEVYLFGQKVYETIVVESFNVGLQVSQDKASSIFSPISQVKKLGVNGAYESTQNGIFNLLSETFKPSQESIKFLSKKLNIDTEETGQLFRLVSSSASVALKVDKNNAAIWSHIDHKNLITSDSSISTLFNDANKSIGIELRIAPTLFDFSNVKNESDHSNIKLTMSISASKKDNGLVLTQQSIENRGSVPFDETQAANCTRDRFSAYWGEGSSSSMISPSTSSMFKPCQVLHSDIENLAFKNGLLKSLIATAFTGVIPSQQTQYGGWDSVLAKLATEVLDGDREIQKELDPHSKTKIISLVSNYLHSLKSELINVKNLRASKELVYQMGLSWSFSGLQVSQLRISEIVKNIDNSFDPFRVSSEALLMNLSRDPNQNDEQINFAGMINATYKAEAIRALNLSKELGYFGFESEIFNQIIQKRVNQADLKIWSENLSAIKSEITKYSALTAVRGELVGASIKWLKNGEATSQDLPAVYSALNNVAEPFSQSTKDLIRNLGDSLANGKPSLDFAAGITAEYKQLAKQILEDSAYSEHESSGSKFFNSVLQLKMSLDQVKVLSDMWASIRTFIQREKGRLEGEISSMPKWNRDAVVALAIAETWSSQDFKAFESIALVAKSKNTCERYKDMSSLANCAGLKLFSRKEKGFFAPLYANRYENLGADFASYMDRLAGFEWTSLRWSMVSEFFGSWEPIWSKCDMNQFSIKSSALKSQVYAIAAQTDQFQKWELERKIKETIRNCN